jgi:alpha-ketoglutarate-dependent taurine dioxygenase
MTPPEARLRSEPLGSSSARVVRRGEHQDLERLPDDEVKGLLVSAGAVLFRGFGADPHAMKRFAERFSDRFNGDQSRPSVPGTDDCVFLVTEGTGYVEPHSEQANSPFRPDAIWFCCETMSGEGGETLLWDGIEILRALSDSTRRMLASKELRFFQRYTVDRWQQFLGSGSTLADATRALDGAPGASYHVGPNESIYLEYVCPPIVRTRFGGHDAFVNSLLLEHRTLQSRFLAEDAVADGVAHELMSFSDGSPIGDELIEELRVVAARVAEEIVWEPGDVAMIDNTRFLHGRNAFTDVRRRLYSCCSFLNF